jgi:signal peptidase
VVRLLAGLYLIALAALLAATLLPLVIGWRPYLITSDSMQPQVPSGSVVLADRDGALSIAVGDVVVVHDPAHPGTLLAHRVAAVRADGSLLTKGDANAAAGSTPVPSTAVIGRVRATVPLLGTVARHRVAALVLAGLAALLMARSRRRRPSLRGLPPRPGHSVPARRGGAGGAGGAGGSVELGWRP